MCVRVCVCVCVCRRMGTVADDSGGWEVVHGEHPPRDRHRDRGRVRKDAHGEEACRSSAGASPLAA